MEVYGRKWKQGKIAQSFLVLFFAFIFVFLGLFLNKASAITTPPSIITYQGKLLYNGSSVTTSQSIAFILYDSLTGGTALYTAAGTLPATSTISVTPSNGLFSVDLGGSGTNALSSSVFQDNAAVYLEVVVGGQSLSPRKQITSAPYALNSQFLNGLVATSTVGSNAYIPVTNGSGALNLNILSVSSSLSIGTTTPEFNLTMENDGGIIARGTYGAGDTLTTAGAGTRMIWYPRKAAFRAGTADTTEWDNANIGDYSAGFGTMTTASGLYSFAGGLRNSATGEASFAYGDTVTASGIGATAFGTNYTNSTNYSLSVGSGNVDNLINSAGNSWFNLDTGNVGIGTASPQYLLDLHKTSANADLRLMSDTGSSTLFITGSTPAATTTVTRNSIMIGEDSTYTGGVFSADYLKGYFSNDLTVGTSTPEFKLTIDGDGGIIARGTYGAGDILTTAGAGTRMIWYPRKGAFRAGGVDGDQWNNANIGDYSVSFGQNTSSTGLGSFSFGVSSIASGLMSFAGGSSGNASGDLSFAFGAGVNASAGYSTAFGYNNTNSNSYSLSVGLNNIDNLINANGNSWLNLDTGNVGIGTSTPSDKLTVVGTSQFTGTSTFFGPLINYGKNRNPSALSSWQSGSPGDADDIFIVGNYAYVAHAGLGLLIFDVSDPTSPSNLSSYDPTEQIVSVYVSGRYAYLAGGVGGTTNPDLYILDVFDPKNPVLVGSASTVGAGNSIYVNGKYAYLADDFGGLKIFNISDPYNPVQTGIYDINDFDVASGLTISGNYAYLAYGGAGLRILDITDSSNPRIVGVYNTSGSARDVYVSGNLAYVADGAEGLVVINVKDPSNPTLVGSYNTAGNAAKVVLSGKFAYVADSTSGLQVIDVTIPASPTLVTTYDTPGEVYGLAVSGNVIYLADGSVGIKMLDITGIQAAQAEIGSAKINNLHIMGPSRFSGVVNIESGLNVGNNGLFLSGDLGISSPTTTGNTSATNTLSFSHTALFKSSATTTESNLFIFDTTNSFSTISSSTAFLLSVRNNGTSKFSVASNGDVAAAGNFYAASINVGTPSNPGDLAERVDIAVDDIVEPGDVLMVDPVSADTYRRTTGQNEQSVAGVVSTNPVIIVGNGKTDYTAVLAMVGRVPVKASAENGTIQRGDLLVSASIPGFAMKYDANKDDNRMVGIIGVALEPLTSGTGKIMSLIRTGWANSHTESISTLRQNIQELASSQGISINTNPVSLNVENQNGQLMYSGGNLNMQGNIILNVASVAGKNDRWSIDANGHFITRVDTTNGKKEMYSMQSPVSEFVFSSSSQLVAGTIKIDFDTITKEIIDFGQPLKVSVTLTSGEAKGIYVSEKNTQGFVVKELGDGTSNASFDWMVVAKRMDGAVVPNEVILEPPQPATVPEISGSVNTSTTENISEPTTSTVSEVITPVPEIQPPLEFEPQPQPEAVSEPEPVTIPAVEIQPAPAVESAPSPTPPQPESTPANP